MSAYLQRLYDAAAALPATGDPRPAQRSGSPLLAVDQRLATTAYAASFLLRLPGEEAPLGVDDGLPPLVTPRASVRDDLAGDRPEARVVAPRPRLAGGREPERGERAVLQPPTGVEPVAPARPVAPVVPAARGGDTAPPARPTEPARSVPPAPALLPLVRDAWPRRPLVAEPTSLPEPSEPAAPPAIPPVVAARSEPALAAPEPVAAPRPKRPPAVAPDVSTVAPDVPTVLHPAPVPTPEPLPAPLTDLAEQVRRLVRATMAGEAAAGRPAFDREPGTRPEAAPPAVQPMTAESMSVIGPLDRPTRSNMLYGLRLR